MSRNQTPNAKVGEWLRNYRKAGNILCAQQTCLKTIHFWRFILKRARLFFKNKEVLQVFPIEKPSKLQHQNHVKEWSGQFSVSRVGRMTLGENSTNNQRDSTHKRIPKLIRLTSCNHETQFRLLLQIDVLQHFETEPPCTDCVSTENESDGPKNCYWISKNSSKLQETKASWNEKTLQ